MTYIELNREKSATTAAVQLFGDLKPINPDVVNLGQGREIDDPDGELGELLTSPLTCSSGYNSQNGGSPELREKAAAWVSRFLGLPATGHNTFVLQQLGRESLGHSMNAATRHDPEGKNRYTAIVPNTMWPMVSAKLADEKTTYTTYRMGRSGIDQDLEEILGKGAGDRIFSMAYFNFPHNPTGLGMTQEHNTKIQAVLDAYNADAANKIQRIDDLPYFANCAQKNNGALLDMGYDGILDADGVTPWSSAISFSKALATAKPGLSILVCHNDLATYMTNRINRSSGLAYVPEFFENLEKLFDERMDDQILTHFASLRAKYTKNRKALEMALGDMVKDGDPGMTSLVEVPEDIFGKSVTCSDGQARTINDLNDVVEFLGNEGVITVNNGGRFLRIAQAQHSDNFNRGVALLQKGLDKILNGQKASA